MSGKVFVDNEILTAADINEHLVNPDTAMLPKAGQAIEVPSGVGGISVAVVYATPYPAGVVPTVVVTPRSPALTLGRIVSNFNNGFSVRFDRTEAGVYAFNWIAVPATG